jgi:hypothetical protein
MGTGGLWSQLQRLRAGIHPVTGLKLPTATFADGTPVKQSYGYARKPGSTIEKPKPDGFYEYIPEDWQGRNKSKSDRGKSALEKWEFLQMKVKLRQRRNVLKTRSEQRRLRRLEAKEVIESFLKAIKDEVGSKTKESSAVEGSVPKRQKVQPEVAKSVFKGASVCNEEGSTSPRTELKRLKADEPTLRYGNGEVTDSDMQDFWKKVVTEKSKFSGCLEAPPTKYARVGQGRTRLQRLA